MFLPQMQARMFVQVSPVIHVVAVPQRNLFARRIAARTERPRWQHRCLFYAQAAPEE
jgi:hypothetical protein